MNKFFKLFFKCNLEKIFDEILSLEIEESKIKAFEEFFVSILDTAIESLEKFPPINEDVFNNAQKIEDVKEKTPFRKGSIYFMPANENDIFYVIGDLHGDLNSFKTFFENVQFLKNPEKNVKIIFLGDYIDRGLYGINILLCIIFLKINFNEQIIMLRGNHEMWKEEDGQIYSTAKGDNMFLEFWKDYFGMDTLRKIKDFFDKLPVILIISNGLIFVHGGIPRPQVSENGNWDYNFLKNLNALNSPQTLEEILWSRPEEKDDVIITFGSPDFSFAKRHFNLFMEKIGGKIMIRAHDAVGFKEFYDGKLFSIFSTGGKGNETAYELYTPTEPFYLKIFDEKICAYNIFPIKLKKMEVFHESNNQTTTEGKKDQGSG